MEIREKEETLKEKQKELSRASEAINTEIEALSELINILNERLSPISIEHHPCEESEKIAFDQQTPFGKELEKTKCAVYDIRMLVENIILRLEV